MPNPRGINQYTRGWSAKLLRQQASARPPELTRPPSMRRMPRSKLPKNVGKVSPSTHIVNLSTHGLK